MPLGRYSRIRPLVFSLVGRSPRRMRVGEVHGQVRGQRQCGMAGHLGALVPGQRAPYLCGEAADGFDEGVCECVGVLAVGQSEDDGEAAGSLHQGRSRGPAGLADDEIAFPRSRHPPVGGYFGAVVDRHHADDAPARALPQRPTRLTLGSLGPQQDCRLRQLPFWGGRRSNGRSPRARRSDRRRRSSAP